MVMRRRSLKKEMDLHDHNRSMVNIITSVCIFLSTTQLEFFILFSYGFKILFWICGAWNCNVRTTETLFPIFNHLDNKKP